MGDLDVDTLLLSTVSNPHCARYTEVIEKLSAIDAALTERDGLRWFTRLYRSMTEAVARAADAQAFLDPVFLEALACRFAELYFEALDYNMREPSRVPHAWRALFEARFARDISGLQFAIAGVNAHINRDLPVALVRTFEGLGGEPVRGGVRHKDYLHINQILAEVHSQAKTVLIADVVALLGDVDDMLEIWSLERARDAAWVAGELRWYLRGVPFLAEQQLAALDRLVGCTGRALLGKVPWARAAPKDSHQRGSRLLGTQQTLGSP